MSHIPKDTQLSTSEAGDKDKLLNKILDNQTRELVLKEKEIEAQNKHDKNALEFAKVSLKTQSEDTSKNIKHHANIISMRYWFAGTVIAIISMLIAYALATGNNAFALEVVKAIAFLIAGAVGGYGYQSSKNNNS
jgi:hypothetical protein